MTAIIMDKHFILTSKTGIYTAGSTRITTIGQTEGCDIRIPNHSPYIDVIFGKILLNRDCEGWHLVKTTTYYPIRINGIEMKRVHYLSDGDNIEVDNHIYRFNIHDGKQSTPTVTHINNNGKLIWSMAISIALIICMICYQFYDNRRENITESMRDEIEKSLYSVRVDSLQLLDCDSIIETYTYASSPSGTAFLTNDSLLITSRHCLQPWLNQILPHDYAKIPSINDWSVKKALFSETENQLSGTNRYRIISYLTFNNKTDESFSISSDEFIMNYALDDIVELGDYNNPQYWRSISHRYSRCDMMLGDVAIAKIDRKGSIPMASVEDLHRLLNKRGVTLTFAGYPEAGVTGNNLDFKVDELRLPISELTDSDRRLFLLAHEGGLTPGFSGGPVLIRDGINYKAVGVISVIDERNGNRAYSVPTSEIETLKNK